MQNEADFGGFLESSKFSEQNAMGKTRFSAKNGAKTKSKKLLTHDCLQNAANKSPSQTASILCNRFPSENLFSTIF